MRRGPGGGGPKGPGAPQRTRWAGRPQPGRAARLYEAWWDKRPPERTGGERRAAKACRGRAERSGWCTGAALDDDRLEEPGYAPRAGWRRAEGTGPAPEDPLDRQTSAGPGGEVRLVPGLAGRREPERELEVAG